ncbi:MAG: hypothetical protein V9G20_30020 [Candidatus Promineifilaceae bacterium]
MQATLSFSNAILEAAALGFLGMGAQPPTPEWGTMLADAREFITARLVGRHLPGPCHPHHRARHQPRSATACATRSIPSSSGADHGPAGNPATSPSPSTPSVGAVPRGRRASTCMSMRARCSAIVGESGSGKSVAMLAVMGLLPPIGDGDGRPP